MKTQTQKNFRKLRVYVRRDKEATQEEQAGTLALLASAMNLAKQIASEVAPVIEANREAYSRMFSYDARNGIENNEELYGRSVAETQRKYAGEQICNYRPGGADCDCEVSEVERGLMVSMGRNESVEQNEAGLSL